MVVIPETRTTAPGDGEPRTYVVNTPMHLASDAAFDAWFAGVLREYLHRKGCKVEHRGDAEILRSVFYTFQTTSARDGITVAKPVDSSQQQPTIQGG